MLKVLALLEKQDLFQYAGRLMAQGFDDLLLGRKAVLEEAAVSVGMLPGHRLRFVKIFWHEASTHNTAGSVFVTVAADPDLVSIIADFSTRPVSSTTAWYMASLHIPHEQKLAGSSRVSARCRRRGGPSRNRSQRTERSQTRPTPICFSFGFLKRMNTACAFNRSEHSAYLRAPARA